MPHVITQSCCSDGSCVFACPVNCIHPTPDEPGFLTAETLHIDPAACVDCGACVHACPVDAIAPDSKLTAEQLPFLEINASFFPKGSRKAWFSPMLAPIPEAPRLRPRRTPLRVAVVGSGPAGMYAADELLTQAGVEVNVFDKLPTPYGLVRAGVAPDHQRTKHIAKLFDQIADQKGFAFYLNVEVGRDITHEELLRHHHAVVYAVGACSDRRLNIPGEELPGSFTATEFVAWANAHPEQAELPVQLDHERAVIVGNGNVALDVARILTMDPRALAATDISSAALAALRTSSVREVVLVGRRGPEFSAFTMPELIGLTNSAQVVLDPPARALVRQALASAEDPVRTEKLGLLATLATRPSGSGRHIRLRYRLTPVRVVGQDRVERVEFSATNTAFAADSDEAERSPEPTSMAAGLFVTSIGYRALPVRDLPFDESAAVVPNKDGRVVEPGTGEAKPGAYVVGWIKRGPSGFIGTNKSCSRETVRALVDDYNNGLLPDPPERPSQLEKLVRARQPETVNRQGWHKIDAAEIARGRAADRVRDKFSTTAQMLAAANARP
ncbi:monooxygenase FAD-binding protein [Segniliparus rotundus DSM 44985]|uniref:ferredoxin--NADP(+) reductase n=1 Tax=Segniliparus rotundus (strain ATCC BAA-972 / CDC 1076 / CIP 108378 / DSM 44985 / JCM 13578) TaxID=640132 RepID=D6ZEI7_SEGRD|nr:FAD-dependent oxidoreductase [Segniliparus rotundus]ADG99463.1 monooxygenase FAD-binding protein [Segniliparus rotundus DSM 44985]